MSPRRIPRIVATLAVASATAFGLTPAAQAVPASTPSGNTGAAASGQQAPTAQEYASADSLIPEGADAQADGAWYSEVRSTAPVSAGFYDIPEQLPSANGPLIKSEPMDLKLDPADLTDSLGKATKVMYKSTDFRGKATGVTGTVLESKRPWKGSGPRPLISFAPGTQGLGDSCQPSNLLTKGLEYEGVTAVALLKAGYNVIMTDYYGGGTSPTLSYLNRVDQGHAVLDAARLTGGVGSSIRTENTPVGIWGYSQGGGASASAAELAGSYAPEIPLKGAYAGAIPADLQAVVSHLDSSLYSAFPLMGAAGLSDSYGVELNQYLTPRGKEAVTKIRTQCLVQALGSFAYVDTSTFLSSGQKLADFTTTNPEFQRIMRENDLGQEGRHPAVPILIGSSWGDDVIPHRTNRELAKRYCTAGSRVSFHTDSTPTHAAAALAITPRALIFFDRQFKGLQNTNDCWQVGA